MEKILGKYENSFGIEKEFWFGLILAYYAKWGRSNLAEEVANEIFERTSPFMRKKLME